MPDNDLSKLLGPKPSKQKSAFDQGDYPPPGGGFVFKKSQDDRDREVILKNLEGALRSKTIPSFANAPVNMEPAIQSQLAILNKLPTKQLAELLMGRQKKESERVENVQAEEAKSKATGEAGVKSAMYQSLGVPPPAPEAPPPAAGVPEPKPEGTQDLIPDEAQTGAGVQVERERQLEEASKALESMQPGSGPEAYKAQQADDMERQKDFDDLTNLIRTSNEGYRADIQRLHDEIEQDRPDLFSLGGIFFMLSNGPKAWLNRHDQQLEMYRERRNRTLTLAAQGKGREAEQMMHAGMARYGAQQADRRMQQRVIPEKAGGDPQLVAESIWNQYGKEIINSPDDSFGYFQDIVDRTTGKVTGRSQVPTSIPNESLEYGRRHHLTPSQQAAIADYLRQRKAQEMAKRK